ncbi:diguanylate cyclase domain-containing protein [[Eubacterium] hominis]|uniref:GGDEF domain-containing protein n=1 Tax=[Eubacterium] hominis TaxID=2764325 RepID=UPI003A4DC51E
MNVILQHYIERLEMLRFYNFHEEKTVALQLLEEALQQQDTIAEAYAYSYLLDSCISTQDNVEARYYMIHALNLCEHLQDENLLLLTYHLCGLYYYYHYDEPSALDYYCKTLSICKQQNDKRKEASILNNIANLFHNRNDFLDAQVYYQKALTLCHSFEDDISKRVRFIILSNLISIEHKQKNKKRARYYLELSEELKDTCLILYLANTVLTADCEQNKADAIKGMDAMFTSYKDQCYTSHQLFEIFDEIIPVAIHFQEQRRAKQALMILCETSNSSNANQMLIVQKHFIDLCECFPCDYDKNMLYQDYFQLVQKANEQNDKVKAQSYHEKMLLNDLMAQNLILKQKVGYDEVTQLKNRHSYHMDSKGWMERKDIKTIGIAMCDIDNFKEFNDHFGHLYGDEIIKKVADILLKHADEHIIPYRFGGDEFLCLFIDKTEADISCYLTDIFCQLEHQQDRLQLSAGFICQKKETIASLNHLIACADEALYQAKNRGKNQFVQYQEQEA